MKPIRNLSLILFAISLAGAAGAARLATENWVKRYVAENGVTAAGETARAEPEAVAKTYTGTLTVSGETYTVSISLATATNLALVVTDSTVAGVTNGTTYAWNGTSNRFETVQSAAMPRIRSITSDTCRTTTNLNGRITVATNRVTRFEAKLNGTTNYWSTTHYGRPYLISRAGVTGAKIGYAVCYVTDARIAAAKPTPAPAPTPPVVMFAASGGSAANALPSMAASGGSGETGEAGRGGEPIVHKSGTLEIGTVTITRAGRSTEYRLDGSLTFNSGHGSGTVAEYAADAFAAWYGAPDLATFTGGASALANLADTNAAWGLGDDASTLMTVDGREIRVSALKGCAAWQQAMAEAKAWISSEYSRIFLAMYGKLKEHTCPALGPNETRWTPEMNCQCRHKYPSLYGSTAGSVVYVECDRKDEHQHVWATYALVGGCLGMSDFGCTLCAWCLTPYEWEGAVHVTVPESYDWCGCYCTYDYTKKEEEEEEETPEEVTPPADYPPIVPYVPDPEPEEEETPVVIDETETDCGETVEEGGGGEVEGGGGQTPVAPPDPVIDEIEHIEYVEEEEEETKTVDCTDAEGNAAQVVVPAVVPRIVAVTNYESTARFRPYWHVRKQVRGADGKAITVITSKGHENLRHVKLQHPLKCTCKCGVQHWFKPSPCPDVCRGCHYTKRAYHGAAGGEFQTKVAGAEHRHQGLRGAHREMTEGWWGEEKYYTYDSSGNAVEHTWTNKDGSDEYASPYTAWYYGTTTGGVHACGCACGRFFSTAAGAHGEAGKDIYGDEADDGHHGNFHIYGLRDTSEIKCPFTKHYYELNGVSRASNCVCNNWDWERSTQYATGNGYPQPWVGFAQKDATGSLACPEACMWHWPSNHVAGGVALNHKRHPGIAGRASVITGAVKTAWTAYWGDDEPECGCTCQALREETCLGADGNGSGEDGILFDVKWEAAAEDPYLHYYDFSESCLCACGRSHAAVTPETMEELDPDGEGYAGAFSACAKNGVCQLCGYYNQSGPTNGMKRAAVEEHVYQSGCHCDCAAQTQSFEPVFKPKGYKQAVRGWSAEQDGDNYPNNTRSRSEGYKHREDVDDYHRSAKQGCLCPCGDEVGHELYHRHAGGAACQTVCKSTYNGGPLCAHAPDYYEWSASANAYLEAYGEHVRTNEAAAYCGCDCGRKRQTKDEDGKSRAWHCRLEDGSMCYCFGRWAHEIPGLLAHEDAELIGHVNAALKSVRPTTNECLVCHQDIEGRESTYECQNGHTMVMETTYLHSCDSVSYRCPYCGWADRRQCTCPYCNELAGYRECTCRRASETLAKFTSPNLGSRYVQIYLENVNLARVKEVDGDDPVYEIGDLALANTFAGCTNLETVNFNYATNAGYRALAGAFRGCTKLKTAGFASLEHVGSGAFDGTFEDGGALEYVSFNSLKNGVVDLYEQERPLTVSASNVSKTAVIDVSACADVREVRLEEAEAVVYFDARWIPLNADFKMYVSAELYGAWTSTNGWSTYATNFVRCARPPWTLATPAAFVTVPSGQTGYLEWDSAAMKWRGFEQESCFEHGGRVYWLKQPAISAADRANPNLRAVTLEYETYEITDGWRNMALIDGAFLGKARARISR